MVEVLEEDGDSCGDHGQIRLHRKKGNEVVQVTKVPNGQTVRDRPEPNAHICCPWTMEADQMSANCHCGKKKGGGRAGEKVE